MSTELPFTGERFVPGVRGEIWIEHWHRYHFATRWAKGRRVLDVACGAGYGTALLARVAEHATGADLSEEAIAHAKGAYAGLANAEFVAAPCTRLPLADASVDVAVSFETVEHIDEQDAFLAELARVLKPGGVLVLSCPNKSEYSDKRNYQNPFHVRELYRAELAQLVGTRFPHLVWYGQRPSFFSVIAPEGAAAAGELFEASDTDAADATANLSAPLYFVLVASRDPAAVAARPPTVSVLADRDDWVHKDYEKVMHGLEDLWKRFQALQEDLKRRGAAAESLEARIRELGDLLQGKEAELAARQLAISEREQTIAAREAEIRRRGGLRWWLRLPLVRLGLLKE